MLVFSSRCLYVPVNINPSSSSIIIPLLPSMYVYIIFMRQHKYEAILLNVKFTMQFPACIYSFKKKRSTATDTRRPIHRFKNSREVGLYSDSAVHKAYERSTTRPIYLQTAQIGCSWLLRNQSQARGQSDTMVWQQPLHYTLTRPDA